MSTPTTPRLPFFLDLRRCRVLLVGGGRTALAKLVPLREAGAMVRAVSLAFGPEFRAAAARLGETELIASAFAPAHLDGVRLVVSATDRPEVNAAVAEAARERNLFVNAVDDPPNCDAYFAAQLRRGPWHLAIGTQGGFPGLSRALREVLEALLPADHEPELADLVRCRERLLAHLPDPEARRLALLGLVEAFQSTYLLPEATR